MGSHSTPRQRCAVSPRRGLRKCCEPMPALRSGGKGHLARLPQSLLLSNVGVLSCVGKALHNKWPVWQCPRLWEQRCCKEALPSGTHCMGVSGILGCRPRASTPQRCGRLPSLNQMPSTEGLCWIYSASTTVKGRAGRGGSGCFLPSGFSITRRGKPTLHTAAPGLRSHMPGGLLWKHLCDPDLSHPTPSLKSPGSQISREKQQNKKPLLCRKKEDTTQGLTCEAEAAPLVDVYLSSCTFWFLLFVEGQN